MSYLIILLPEIKKKSFNSNSNFSLNISTQITLENRDLLLYEKALSFSEFNATV